MIGTRIGQYTVLEKIGEGGMGAVWKARDEKLGRTVALKFLSKADSPDGKARFTQEARAASSLSHPGIVTIFDIFEHGDQACIAMEFVDGRTLSQVIPAGGLPVREVIRLGTQIADALSAAHRAGVIHRDIKPGNIIVTPDGRAKLLDFGLAKLAEIAAAPNDATQTAGDVRTSEGSILGTVNYMSPEQAQGKPVDPRTDIFSLGAVLYEMATGAKAFQGDTTVSTITAILRDEPKPVPVESSGVSKDVARVISQCMRKETDRRFQTALDVRNALEQLHEEIKSGAPVSAIQVAPSPLPSPAPRPRRPWMLPAAAGLVVLAGLGVWTLMRRPDAPVQPMDSIVVRPFGANLTGAKAGFGFSPDGNAIVMAWDGGQLGAPTSIYATLLDSGRPLRLTTSSRSRDVGPFYASDGRKVFFTRFLDQGPATFSVPALGGDETRVADGFGEAVSQDGQWLVVSRLVVAGSTPAASGTFVVRLSDGQERQLLPPSADFNLGGFDFSPDGKWIYFSQGQVGAPPRAMRVPFAGGQPEAVDLPAIESEVAQILEVSFFGRNVGMVVLVLDKAANSPRTYLMKTDGTRPLLLPASVPTGAISPDGRRAISGVGYGISPLYRAPAFPARGQAVAPEKALDTPRAETTPRFSPDGSRVVVSSMRSGRSMLWLWNAALTDGKPIFDQASSTSGSPNWSPDGRWIAFDARVKTNVPDIWIVPSSGGTAMQLTDDPAEDNTPCFDATSEWVYFTSSRDGDQQLYKVARTGGPQSRVTKGGGFNCQVSPDGKFIYYLQGRERGGLWRQELATGQEEAVLPEYRNRNFRVLADGIYLLDVDTNASSGAANRPGTAKFYRFAAKKIETLGFTTPRPINGFGIDLSPDRKWVYFSMIDAQATDLQLVENLPFR